MAACISSARFNAVMSVAINFASTISPTTACDAFIAIPKSSCSSDVPIVVLGRPDAYVAGFQVSPRASGWPAHSNANRADTPLFGVIIW
jgi:hypothetical protein